MYKIIINSFINSSIVTERNKNNLIKMIQKQPDRSFEEQHIEKIKSKSTNKKYTVMEN
jgi:hypothetical protein